MGHLCALHNPMLGGIRAGFSSRLAKPLRPALKYGPQRAFAEASHRAHAANVGEGRAAVDSVPNPGGSDADRSSRADLPGPSLLDVPDEIGEARVEQSRPRVRMQEPHPRWIPQHVESLSAPGEN